MKSVPPRRLRRMTPEERQAYDLLTYGSPGPGERAIAKLVLGRRRTREETLAHAEALAAGLTRLEVADRLQVDPRYLDRLLRESSLGKGPTPEIGSEKAPASRGFVGLPDTPKVIPLPEHLAGRQVYGSDPFSYDFRAAIEATVARGTA
jgi:hypothetical protein